MRWLRWLRAFLSGQAALALRVVVLEDAAERDAAQRRLDDALRDVTVRVLRAELAAARREAESLNAANEERNAEILRERVWGNTMAHRIAAAHQLADRLPPDLAADLRGCLSPAFPSAPEEAAHVR